MSVCTNRRLVFAAVVAVGALAPMSGRAFATIDPYIKPQSHLEAYEYVIDPDHRYEHTNVSQSVWGTGTLQYHYSTNGTQSGGVNNAAYVDPATGKMRVYAVSDASVFGTAGIEPPFNLGPQGNRSAAGAAVSYSKKLEVTAGTSGLNAGDPAQLTLTFHLDGRLAIGGVPHDAAAISSSASMNAHFTIYDPAVITGDDSTYEVARFSADARRTQYEVLPDATIPDGAQVHTKDYNWSLTSNHPGEPVHEYHDGYLHQVAYNADTEGGTTVPPAFVPDFDTGILNVTFDTYVGAILDISAGLAVETASDALSESPYASANFMNTFALDFQPAAGFEGLALVSNAAVPEPASLSLLALAIPLVARRRSR